MADGASKKPSETISPGGMSKVERYKWKTGTKPGVLGWIGKHKIRLPGEDTQRGQEDQEQKIRAIAANFEWPGFGALVVVRRSYEEDEDSYYVIDGGGRLEAAKRRSDIDEVPCIVFEMTSLAEEAQAFLTINTKRKPVKAVAKFRPQLTAGIPEAAVVEALCMQAGRRVAAHPGPNTVACVACLMRLAKTDGERLRRVWPLIVEVCRGEAIHERVVDGLMYIDKHMEGPELLTDRRWATRAAAVGPSGLLAAAARAAAFFSAGGAKVWAQGMVEALNKGLKEEKRLRLRT